MKVRLGTFACSTIESIVGVDLVAGIQAALHHYTRRRQSGLPPVDLPGFFRGATPEPDGTVFEVPIDASIEERLNREVRRLGTTLEQLTTHAVLVYLADLDRGFRPELEPAAIELN